MSHTQQLRAQSKELDLWNKIRALKARTKELEAALQQFVNRCDDGDEICLYARTYKEFKTLLAEQTTAQMWPPG